MLAQIPPVVGIIVVGAGGVFVGYLFHIVVAKMMSRDASKEKNRILHEARQQAETQAKEIELQAKQEIIQRRETFENEVQETRRELRQTERRLDKREDALDEKDEILAKKERYLDTGEKNLAENRRQLAAQDKEVHDIIERQREQLYRISSLTREEAKNQLLESLLEEAEKDCEKIVNQKIARAQERGEDESRRIIVDTIQRCAAETTSHATVTAIELPNDELKGRIIGREGRNIRSFEKATGVDVIVDDTPGVVVLSSFDSVRREVARLAMHRLVSDGRIHPGRIEEVVSSATKEVEQTITRTGKETCYDLGLPSIPNPLKDLIGRLKFRTSFGQNVLQHSIEVCNLAGLIAAEVGLDVDLARRCGLLHDIGKALDQDHEGSHAQLGAERAKHHNERAQVVNAIAAHHEDEAPTSLYAGLIIAADTMSASRPGARRETLERYVKRLQRLENLANQHSGVDRAFAIHAGRELRVLVDCSKVSDKNAEKMCRDIANDVQEELQYPGDIVVTVIRESRFTETAH